MKKILLFIDSLGAGGAQRQLIGLASMLKDNGYSVKVATYYNHSFYKYILDEKKIDYECFNVNSRLSWINLIRCVSNFKANVLISYQTNPNSIACVVAAICRIPLIVSERNTHQYLSLKDKIIFNLYRFADFVVSNSYSETAYINARFPFLRNKTYTIPNFVDLNRFSPSAKYRNDEKIILIVASVKASKNTKSFIWAYYQAYLQGCNVKVLWYGVNRKEDDLIENVIYVEECKQMINDLGIEAKFQLLPKRQDIQNVYHEADVFCLPSYFEGTPNALCEAMASGLPIIASNVCDNPRFVKPAENGWLFDPNDINDMVATIIKISQASYITLSRFGENSRRFVEAMCAEEDFVKKYIQLIESL